MTRRIISGRNAVRFVKDPPPGEKGDSLVSFTVYFKLTRTLEPPSTLYVDEAHGWYATTSASCPRAATAEYPFLWEYDVYVFDNESLNKQVLKLAQTMQPDIRPNLLEQTAFEPGYMDKWQNVGHSEGAINVDVHNGHNAYGHMPIARWQDSSQNWYNYYNMLCQRVMNNQEGWTKLKGDSWYTLSFWARTRIYENATSNLYGFNFRTLQLHPGTYRLTFNGHCSADAVSKGNYLGVAVFLQDAQSHWVKSLCSWWNSSSILTETVDTTKTCPGTLTITVEEEATYTAKIGFYAFKNGYVTGDPLGDVTINWWKLEDVSDNDHGLLNVYCYSSVQTEPLMPGATFFVDGKVMEHAQEIDGCTAFHLADDEGDSEGWTRHWVAWRTKQVIPEAIQNVLWRGFRTYVEISQPKLEEGIMPTDWCPNDNDPQVHYSHNPRGDWWSTQAAQLDGHPEKAVYRYYMGIRDVVRARTENANVKTWFRMKKRTDSNGYTSNTDPYLDTEHWERASQLNFAASELIMAEQAVIENAIVRMLRTNDRNGADKKCVEVNGNQMCVYDTNGNLKGRLCGENISSSGVGQTQAVPTLSNTMKAQDRNTIEYEEDITLWNFEVTATNNKVVIPMFLFQMRLAATKMSRCRAYAYLYMMIDDTVLEGDRRVRSWDYGQLPVGTTWDYGESTGWLQELFNYHELNLSVGQHRLHLYTAVYFHANQDYQGLILSYQYGPNSSGANYVLDYTTDILEIGANGLKAVFGSALSIAQFTKDNNVLKIAFRSQGYGIEITPDGIKVWLNNTAYWLGRNNTGQATLTAVT